MRALVIEDEAHLRKTIVATLREEGFAADHCEDGEEGLYKALNWDYDVILLDVMLPKMSGWQVLEAIRAEKETPILMLTARDGIQDRVRGLNQGADDYLPKPFDLLEMVARARAIARRSFGRGNPVLTLNNIEVNTASRTITKDGELIELTAREYAIVELFALKKDEVVTREYLYEHLFDENEDSLSNMLDVYIYKLRQKFGKNFITTLRGQGYVVRSNTSA